MLVQPSLLWGGYYFTGRKSWAYGVNFYLHFVARLSLGDEDYETFDPCDSVTTTAGLLDLDFVLLPFFDWLMEGTIAHAFHLDFGQLVLRVNTARRSNYN